MQVEQEEGPFQVKGGTWDSSSLTALGRNHFGCLLHLGGLVCGTMRHHCLPQPLLLQPLQKTNAGTKPVPGTVPVWEHDCEQNWVRVFSQDSCLYLRNNKQGHLSMQNSQAMWVGQGHLKQVKGESDRICYLGEAISINFSEEVIWVKWGRKICWKRFQAEGPASTKSLGKTYVWHIQGRMGSFM